MFVKISEQPSLYNDLEKKSVREILEDINTEDQKVALAVQRAIPQIEKLVTQIVPRMKQGGRIFYMGAGTSGRLGVLDASEIPPTFGMPPTLVIGLIAGGDTALRNPVENAEDDISRCQVELFEEFLFQLGCHLIFQDIAYQQFAQAGSAAFVSQDESQRRYIGDNAFSVIIT